MAPGGQSRPSRIARRARQDSNLRPLAPEASALSTELRARVDGWQGTPSARAGYRRACGAGPPRFALDGPRRRLRRHGRLGAHRPRAACPRCCCAAAATACCSTAARARSASCCARSACRTSTRVFLTHFHADHWLGLPGMLKTFDLRDRESAARRLRAARARALLDVAAPRLSAASATRRARRARRRARRSSCDGYAVAAVRRSPPRRARSATRSSRTTARAASTPSSRASSAWRPGPDFGRLQRGEAVGGVAPRAGHRRGAARAAARALRRHARRATWSARSAARRRPARARGDVPRRGRRARARDRPLAPPRRRRRSRATRTCGCSR